MFHLTSVLWKEFILKYGRLLRSLTKNRKEEFTGSNGRPISILPVLGKLMEKIISKQIQNDFSIHGSNSDFQHAYKSCYSTYTALTQLTDDWLKHIDCKLLVGTVLLDCRLMLLTTNCYLENWLFMVSNSQLLTG